MRAVGAKAYLKSELEFLGVPVPIVRATALDFLASHSDLAKEQLVALVRALWATEVHELRSLGVALLDELRAGRGDFEHFARLARHRPELTFEFVKEHRAELSGLTFREASRNLPAAMKCELGLSG